MEEISEGSNDRLWAESESVSVVSMVMFQLVWKGQSRSPQQETSRLLYGPSPVENGPPSCHMIDFFFFFNLPPADIHLFSMLDIWRPKLAVAGPHTVCQSIVCRSPLDMKSLGFLPCSVSL